MHLFAQTQAPNLPIFFNVDSSVGQGGANSNQEDILLVQLLLKKAAERPPATVPASTTQRVARVTLSGTSDSATIDGIRAIQERMRERNPGTIVDGRVSPARGVSYGEADWTIVTLNTHCRRAFPEVWPRLQDFRDCPPQLRARFAQLL